MSRAFRVGVCITLVALLAGCPTTPQRVPQAQSWETRRTQLQQRDHFDLRARVAVAAGTEGFNAGMRWVQAGSQSNVSLDGPLGVGGAQISFDGTSLTVRTSRGQQLNDADARAELLSRLGFEPPLRSLRYWMQGVPDPATPADEVVDEQQRLATLKQEGWQIEYGSYRAARDEWLPERLTLTREGVRVRLIVNNWNL